MHYGTFMLSFKITNWCNLNCAHCCENSGPNHANRFLSLNKIEKYLQQFKELPYSISEHIVIGGGEGLAPYLFGNLNYIPRLLSMIDSVWCVPTIKTNGAWGNNAYTRNLILQDLTMSAHKMQKLVTLDISVDEFHNNTSGVASIFADILSKEYIMSAIRPTLVGFNTPASHKALSDLKKKIRARKMILEKTEDGDLRIYNERGQGIYVVCDFGNEIFDLGRAKKNNVYTYHQTGPGLLKTNCIQIDNNDTVTLNNYYREKFNHRPLKTVMNSLIYREK